ncbi:hypothetical protein Tco_1347871, partial [Tanacetum coccineum]
LPKKSRGKGSKGTKTTEESHETVDVSEESEPKPEPVKKKTASKRVVKKKVTLLANDNIISDDPDIALELAKSISQTEAEEVEAARKVHVTHARIMTESISESAKKKPSGKSSKSVVIQDTPSAPKSKPTTSKTNLKGAPSLTPEQEATNIMQPLKESKKTSKRLLGTGGSNERTGTILGVPNEFTVISATSSEGTSAKPGVLDKDKDITKEKVILKWGDEQDSEFFDDDEKVEKDGDADDEVDDHVIDKQDDDDEDEETESNKDDIYKYKIRVHKDEDEEIKDAEVEGSDKGDEEITNATKEEVEKTSEATDDTKKTKLPPSSSSLSFFAGYCHPTQNSPDLVFISTEDSRISDSKDNKSSTYTKDSPIPTLTITTDAPTITTDVPESNALTAIELRVAKLEKDVSELKTIEDVFQMELQKHTTYLIHKYSLQHLLELTKKPTPTNEKEYDKIPSEILKIKKEQAESQKNSQFTIKSTNKVALKEYDLKSDLYQSMHANKSFNRNPANYRLYHALMEALIENENDMDKGVADTVKDHKRKHDDDEDNDYEDPPAGPNQGKKAKRRRTKEPESSKKPSSTKETPKGKAPTKGSKTSKSALAKEPVEEPIAEVIMDDVGDDLVHDDDQPQAASKPKTSKTMNPEWFKQPPRPHTPDPEWNKRQVVLDHPAQPWFNQKIYL